MLVALGANLLVAVAKGAGGVLSGSSALLSEAAHSVADCLNEIFLLLSLNKAERPADRTHPFGYGKERFFWSLLAAVGIFVSGAGYSAYQGISELTSPPRPTELREFVIVYVVLAASLLLEGWSLRTAVGQVREQAGEAGRSPATFLRRSPDPSVKTVASEDAAAVVGIVLAAAGTALHQLTGNQLWDGLASLAIAVLLAGVAVVLGKDSKDLLIGESADPAVRLTAYSVLDRRPEITGISELLTMQLGPNSVLVAAHVQFDPSLSAGEVERTCTEAEVEMRERVPSLRQVFLDPSRPSGKDSALVSERLAQTQAEVAQLDGEPAVRATRSGTARRVAGRQG